MSYEVPSKSGNQTYSLENAWLLFILILIAEALLAVAVFVSETFINESTLVTRTFSIASAVAGTAILALLFVLIWNGAVVKPKAIERFLREIPWGGNEIVADVRCGSGMLMSRASGRLTTGYALGLEAVRQGRLRERSGSFPNTSEGEFGTQMFTSADSRSLPIRDEAFDVAVSGFGARRFRKLADRILLMDELVRILKPGGTIAVMVTEDPSESAVLLREKGLVDISITLLRSFVLSPTSLVIARKITRYGAD